ncbi:glutathione S-transferase family protein [Myxococcaceae bacterium GXIMD 01537]
MAPPKLVLCEVPTPADAPVESYSPFCLKVHRGLKYLGLPYERRAGLPGAFKKHYSTGQVPVLVIDEKEGVGDSTDILRRLEEVAGRRFLDSNDPKLAAEALLWEELADTSLAGFVIASRFADERNWPRARAVFLAPIPAPLRGPAGAWLRRGMLKLLVMRDVWRAGPEACWRRFTEQLDQLEARAPESGFWLGPFSQADLGIFSMLHSLRLDLTPWQRDQIAQRPRLSRYLDRVDAATRGTQAVSAAA